MKHPLSIILLLVLLFTGNFALSQNIKDNTDTLKQIEQHIKSSQYQATRNAKQSIRQARNALKLSKSKKAQKHIAQSYFQLGYGHYNLNQYDSAIYYLDKAAVLSEQTGSNQILAKAHNRLGNSYQLQSNFNKAIDHYQKALTINQKLENKKEIARSLTNIGSVYRTFGEYNKAIEFHLEALSIYEQIGYQEGIAWSSLNISRLFKLNEDYGKALEYLDKSLSIYRKIAREENIETGVTLCLKEYGRIYLLLGQPDKALEYSKKVLKRNQTAGNEYGIGNCYYNMSKIFLKKKDYSTSLNYLKKSLNIKNNLNDKTAIPSILRLMGENHLRMGHHENALDFFSRALEKARSQNMKEEIKDIYKDFYTIYQEKKQYQKALEYYSAWSELKDSLNNQKISELEMQYDFEKKQERLKFEQKKQQAIQEAKLKKQKILIISFIAGFILLLALSIVIYKSYKTKVRSNIQLANQKREIENHRDEIEAQRNTATEQRDKIAKQNKIITESIGYASRIQNAVLPQNKTIEEIFGDYFILYKPKNIVSGDFYWINQIDSKIVIAAADCTGHGVPGAFMSMLGTAFLNEIINQNRNFNPGKILTQLRSTMIKALHQDMKKRSTRDGMDIALSIINLDNNEIYFSGAYNPLYIIRNNSIIELKANRMPIGIHAVYQDIPFSVHKETLKKGDRLYFFSDGYFDQFGGEKGNKFGRKAFRNLLIDINQQPMEEQREALEHHLKNWMGSWQQIDDIMVLGFKYNQS